MSGRAGIIRFWTIKFLKCRNAGQPGIRSVRQPVSPASGQSGTGWTKLPVSEPVWYQNKGTQLSTGMLRYQAGSPAASFLMPVPGYAFW